MKLSEAKYADGVSVADYDGMFLYRVLEDGSIGRVNAPIEFKIAKGSDGKPHVLVCSPQDGYRFAGTYFTSESAALLKGMQVAQDRANAKVREHSQRIAELTAANGGVA